MLRFLTWYNNVYSYNKNTIKSLPVTNKYTLKLIKVYFNLYSLKLEKKIRLSKLPNWMRRLSVKRIIISNNTELKHTSDKVIITIYIYNKFEVYILNKINRLIKKKLSIKKIKWMKNRIQKIYENNNIFKVYDNIYIRNIFKKFLFRIKLYMYYKQVLLLNEFKLRDNYIIALKTLLEKIYNKKVEFKLISLRYYYLNSNIYLQVLALKLRNRKNRIYRVLRKSFLNIKLPSLQELILYTDSKSIKLYKKGDNINDLLDNMFYNYQNSYEKEENIILSSIKNRIPAGIRIEAKGRLSKRLIASRSIFKYKYIGNLRNLNSSYLGISSPMLRGNLRYNLDYTKLKSKTKIGSFGLKSWINNI